jgi:glycosyltransferase involved in cell wall biosynthesis
VANFENAGELPLYGVDFDDFEISKSGGIRGQEHPCWVAQFALSRWNAYRRTSQDELRREFAECVSLLMDAEVRLDHEMSGWPVPLRAAPDRRNVLSAGTQGTVASALIRAWLITGDDSYGQAARRALRAFEVEILDGGVLSVVGAHGMFFEDVAVYPASHNLRGAALGLIGLYDYVDCLNDTELALLAERATSSLHAMINLYDTGFWTRVDLLGKRFATAEEHALHVRLVRALANHSGCRHCRLLAEAWDHYEKRRSRRLRGAIAGAATRGLRAVARAAGQLLVLRVDGATLPTSRYPVCISLPAFPVSGGTRAIVTAMASAMKDEWDVTYLTNRVGSKTDGMIVEAFGGRISTPWQFPNVWFHAMAGLNTLRRLIRQGKEFRIILPQDGSYTAFFSAMVGKACGARVVSVEHGTVMLPYSDIYRGERIAGLNGEWFVRRLADRLRLALYWFSLHLMASMAARFTDLFMVAGDEIEETYRERLGIHFSQIVRFNPSIDAELFRPLDDVERKSQRERLGLVDSNLVIVMNGRLAPEKGLEIALEAVAEARERLNADRAARLRLLLAGSGPSRADVEAKLRACRLTPISRLVGEADPSEVAALLGVSDVFLYTSVRGTNTSLAVLEAMAAGCAVIASEQPASHAELLADCRGISTPPGDVTATSVGLLRVLQDDNLRINLGKLARNYVIHKYSQIALKRALLRATFYVPPDRGSG